MFLFVLFFYYYYSNRIEEAMMINTLGNTSSGYDIAIRKIIASAVDMHCKAMTLVS